jgi:hypothetical protein
LRELVRVRLQALFLWAKIDFRQQTIGYSLVIVLGVGSIPAKWMS